MFLYIAQITSFVFVFIITLHSVNYPFFFFNDTATTEIYTLSLHDALPILTKGRYKIRLKPGPSYEGQKEEGLFALQSVLQADKGGQVFPMIADLYAENLPLDNTLEIRNRLRTIVPQEIIEAGKTGKPLPPKPPQ